MPGSAALPWDSMAWAVSRMKLLGREGKIQGICLLHDVPRRVAGYPKKSSSTDH